MADYRTLIEQIALTTNVKSYLELGISDGRTFKLLERRIPNSVGVDFRDWLGSNKVGKFFHMKTDEFFSQNEDTFDLIFIDADHTSQQAIKDFENSLKILNKNGTIVIHDTDPINKNYLAIQFCNDSYKLVDFIRMNQDLECITLPVGVAGLTIVRRKDDRRVLNFI